MLHEKIKVCVKGVLKLSRSSFIEYSINTNKIVSLLDCMSSGYGSSIK